MHVKEEIEGCSSVIFDCDKSLLHVQGPLLWLFIHLFIDYLKHAMCCSKY